MLNACAPGHESELKKHRIWVSYNGKTFYSIRKGGHGERDPEVKSGVIRKMVRVLGISVACANAHLDGLRLQDETA